MRNRILIVLLASVSACGCARLNSRAKVDYRAVGGGSCNTEAAEAIYQEGLMSLCEGDRVAAEQLFNQSLVNDRSFGPAHNALGKLHYDRGNLYLAAQEFEEAKKLMPTRTEPLNNLGLIYESVGQFDRAIEYFDLGLATNPDNAEVLGNFIRARIRSGDRSGDLKFQLEKLVRIDDRRSWRDWARTMLATGKVDDLAALLLEGETIIYDEAGNAPRMDFEVVPESHLNQSDSPLRIERPANSSSTDSFVGETIDIPNKEPPSINTLEEIR